jgi:hypothetical protein
MTYFCAGLIFFHFQKLSAERAGLADLDVVQKEWMAIVPYVLSLKFQKVRACSLSRCLPSYKTNRIGGAAFFSSLYAVSACGGHTCNHLNGCSQLASKWLQVWSAHTRSSCDKLAFFQSSQLSTNEELATV